MKHAIIVLLVCILAASSFSQTVPIRDGIGIYFDMSGTSAEYITHAPFEQVTAYLLATYIRETSGISGWECHIETLGDMTGAAWTVSAGINVADPSMGLFNVGIGVGPLALPAEEVILLATLTAFILSPMDIVQMTVGPFPGSVSFDDTPGYAAGSDAQLLIPFVNSNRCTGLGAVTLINMLCPVATDDRTWSEIKTQFR